MGDFIVYAILGVLQGVFEWIPISSEGVVALAAQALDINANPVDFALFLHLGTLAAALGYYWRDWINVISFKDRKLTIFLAIATAISLPLGFVMYKLVSRNAVGAGLLIVTGFGLLFTAYFQKKKIVLNLSGAKLAAVCGILQGLAVIPGFSRSGSTIFGLSLAKSDPREILKLSYLMSVSAVAASTGYLLLFKVQELSLTLWPAVLFSFLGGLAFLGVLTRLGEKMNFFRFALVFAFLCFAGALLELLG